MIYNIQFNSNNDLAIEKNVWLNICCFSFVVPRAERTADLEAWQAHLPKIRMANKHLAPVSSRLFCLFTQEHSVSNRFINSSHDPSLSIDNKF